MEHSFPEWWRQSPRYTSDGYYATADPISYAWRYHDHFFMPFEYSNTNQGWSASSSSVPSAYSSSSVAPSSASISTSTSGVSTSTTTALDNSYSRARPGHDRGDLRGQHRKPSATEVEARKWSIPSGYSLHHWDPSEKPILLLGSVFDADSLGKWIFDWTIYHYGYESPTGKLASHLWLLLIQLAGGIGRAEGSMGHIRAKDQKIVGSYIKRGGDLMVELQQILEVCGDKMLKTGRMGKLSKLSGIEFVKCIFGRRGLKTTDELMTGIESWVRGFDADCQRIFRD